MIQKKEVVSKKQIKKSKVSVGKIVAIGAGVAALGAGAYYLLGPDGKKNQKKVTSWMNKMKKEVEKKVSTVKNVTESIYHDAVDSLATSYSKEYKEFAPEIKIFAKKLKSDWKSIEKKTKPTVKKVQKIIEKKIIPIKKVTKNK